MLAVRCPNCSAPAPVNLATADALACASCGHAGPMPPEASRRLAEAAAVLSAGRESDRQLDARQRKALAWAGSAKRRLALFVGASVTPLVLGCAFLWMVLALDEAPDRTLQGFVALPLVMVALVVRAGWRAVGRGGRALAEACAASPPPSPGEPCACRVCGAPVMAGADVVARCDYCRADNVVDPSVVAAVAGSRVAVVEGHAAEVERRASATRGLGRRVGVAVAVSVLAAPVASLVLLVAVAVGLDAMETPVHAENRYAIVAGAHGRCIALVTQVRGQYRISYGAGPIPYEDRASTDGLELVGAQTFAGRSVLVDGRAVTVRRAFGTRTGADKLDLEGLGAREVEGTCLAH